MESDPREQLAMAERAEAAPYIDYPPTPWWYSPVVGLWTAAMIGASTLAPALFIAAIAVLIALEGVFLGWMQRRHGALPFLGRGRPPREIAAMFRGYLMGFAIVVAAVGLAWWLAGVPAAAPAAFVLVTAGLAGYERRYARAAARARERLQ